MKFSTTLLSLVAASSVLSFTINTKGGLNVVENSTDSVETTSSSSTGPKSFFDNLTKECREDLEKSGLYEDCIAKQSNINSSNHEEICKMISSDKCIKYHENPLAEAPHCVNDTVYNEEISINKNNDPKRNYFCLRGTKGNLCPVTKTYLTQHSFSEADVVATCESKACTEGLIDYIQNSIDNNERFYKIHGEQNKDGQAYDSELTKKVLQSYLDILKNENCTADAVDDKKVSTYIAEGKNNDYSSGANNVKSTGILFTTLCLVLDYLL